MKSPLDFGAVLIDIGVVETTQKYAIDQLHAGKRVGVVYAENQTHGRGRFNRHWVSEEGQSLTASLIFHAYPNHPAPYLIGMALAIAAAGAIHAQLQWPNDLVIRGKKVGGILTEWIPTFMGERVAVVGIGINLNQTEFPEEIRERATSLHLAYGHAYEGRKVLQKIIERLALVPEPTSWSALAPAWQIFDQTKGKKYKLPDGQIALGLGIGSEGQLMASIDGESHSVLAADAIFGA
ncbi:MAG: biotin--[acetyl-CoA-carboxylase] ligase [Fimbriimonas sp.]